jgi:hypothetical protein
MWERKLAEICNPTELNEEGSKLKAEDVGEVTFSKNLHSITLGLRARGQRAERFSFWMMIALIFTTLSGLFYYVAFPAWFQFQDAERKTYLAQASIFEDQLREMDARRNEAWGDLVVLLDFTAREVSLPSQGAFRSVRGGRGNSDQRLRWIAA